MCSHSYLLAGTSRLPGLLPVSIFRPGATKTGEGLEQSLSAPGHPAGVDTGLHNELLYVFTAHWGLSTLCGANNVWEKCNVAQDGIIKWAW